MAKTATDLGLRQRWIHSSWAPDTSQVTQWHEITTDFIDGSSSVRAFRLVLGWDGSPTPEWIYRSRTARLETNVSVLPTGAFDNLLEPKERTALRSGESEVRRLEVPVHDWAGVLDARMFRLELPLVAYEVWTDKHSHALALASWSRLSTRDQRGSGISRALLGHLGSTVILIPQLRCFLCGSQDLVVMGGTRAAQRLQLVMELLDGPATLSRSTCKVALEKPRKLTPREQCDYLHVRFAHNDFSSLNQALTSPTIDFLTKHPQVKAGMSGSDFKLTLVDSATADATTTGTIRGLGDGYFSTEPWRDRAPAHGFSAPGRVFHVPKGAAAGREALKRLATAGAPIALCDPYANPRLLGEALAGGRLLVKKENFSNDEREWCASHGTAVRSVDGFHDRLVIGRRRAFLVGTSLQGLGAQHSFLVELDNQMRATAQAAFETLWARAKVIQAESV